MIKKTPNQLDLWVIKRKPRPVANVYPPLDGPPPIEVFPAYLPVRCTQTVDEQPEPSVDDPPSVWILRRGKLHQKSRLVRLRRITPPKPIFKNSTRADRLVRAKLGEDRLVRRSLAKTGFLRQTSRNFCQFIAKPRLDNKAAIRYLNPTFFYDNENYRWVSDPTTYWDSTG